MVLPPIESTPTVLVRFTPKSTRNLVSLVEKHIEQWNVIVVTEEASSEQPSMSKRNLLQQPAEETTTEVVLGLSALTKELEHEAEVRQYVKPTKMGMMDIFTRADRDEFEDVDDNDFFSWAERTTLVLGIFNSITVLRGQEERNDLFEELNKLKADFREGSAGDEAGEREGELLTLAQVLEQNGFVDCISPLHYGPERDRIVRETMALRTPCPVKAIRDYYGEEIAFYFAWLETLTQWLVFPAVCSVLIYVARWYNEDTIDTCIITPFFGMGMFLWAVSFNRFWRRRESRLAYEWGTFVENGTSRRQFQSRSKFRGVIRMSPVTGRLELYYDPWKRKLFYLFSALVTMILLFGAFSVMIISLNLQGYIHPENNPTRWEDGTHPFHFPFFADLSSEGQIFDSSSTFKSILPVIIHAACIFAMNSGYRLVAEKLTEWENHELENEYQNSLIMKRFFFEAFDSYIALFYLAFFERNIGKLRGELVNMFNIDTFRRGLCEYVIPKLAMWLGKRKRTKRKSWAPQRKKKDDDAPGDDDYMPLSEEADREEYELYDDYLEIVLELGYLCLFASAYPLAAFVAIIAHTVEIRSDCLQISRIYRKYKILRTDSIGTWRFLIGCIVWMSALTNCLIFAYTSRQMMQYAPSFFYIAEDGDQDVLDDKEWLVALVVFGVERLLLFIGIVINLAVPVVPSDVEAKIEHQSFVRAKEARMMRQMSRRDGNVRGLSTSKSM